MRPPARIRRAPASPPGSRRSRRPGARARASVSAGRSIRQMSIASGQRGWKRQPGGGAERLGGAPLRPFRTAGVADPAAGSGSGAACRDASGGRRARAVGASSTRRPAYMMPSRSAMLACTDMSWVTKSIEEAISRWISRISAEHVLLHHDVERRGRLVGDDELGPADRRERDRDALAHAARELVRIGVEHARPQVQPVEVALDDARELRHRLADVAEGEVEEGVPHPAHRVQHVHRALHDVGDVLPADGGERRLVQPVDVAVEEAVRRPSRRPR